MPNRVDDVGCSIDDLIAVAHIVERLRAAGLVNGGEGGAIVSAAARSGSGR